MITVNTNKMKLTSRRLAKEAQDSTNVCDKSTDCDGRSVLTMLCEYKNDSGKSVGLDRGKCLVLGRPFSLLT